MVLNDAKFCLSDNELLRYSTSVCMCSTCIITTVSLLFPFPPSLSPHLYPACPLSLSHPPLFFLSTSLPLSLPPSSLILSPLSPFYLFRFSEHILDTIDRCVLLSCPHLLVNWIKSTPSTVKELSLDKIELLLRYDCLYNYRSLSYFR